VLKEFADSTPPVTFTDEGGNMTRLTRRHLLVAVLAGLALLATPVAALATYGITLSGAVTTFTCLDGQTCDSNPGLNAITLVLGGAGTGQGGATIPTAAGTGINGQQATTFSLTGIGTSTLDIGWTINSSGTLGNIGNPLIVTASNTGYVNPGAGLVHMLSQVNGNYSSGTGSLTAQQWDNLSNTFFGVGGSALPPTGVTCGPLGPFLSGTIAGSCSTNFASVIPYSLSDQLSLQVAANSGMSGDFFSTVTGVPEASTLLLLGTGLAGLQGFVWRRSRRR
jgi:hypothetical protein